MEYARIENGRVAERISVPAMYTLDRLFPAEFCSRCVPCGNEVVQGWTYDGNGGFTPPEEPAQTPEQRLAEIDARLAGIDAESARPLRAVVSGTAEDADHAKLAALEAEAAALREERRGLA